MEDQLASMPEGPAKRGMELQLKALIGATGLRRFRFRFRVRVRFRFRVRIRVRVSIRVMVCIRNG